MTTYKNGTIEAITSDLIELFGEFGDGDFGDDMCVILDLLHKHGIAVPDEGFKLPEEVKE